MNYAICMIVLFPLELFRFTIDLWRYTLDGIGYRIVNKHKDQPCIYCRGMDLGQSPRRMRHRIRYYNLWLLKCVNPELQVRHPPGQFRPSIACSNEGGYVSPSRMVPWLAMVLTLIWICCIAGLLWQSGLVPEEIQNRVLMK